MLFRSASIGDTGRGVMARGARGCASLPVRIGARNQIRSRAACIPSHEPSHADLCIREYLPRSRACRTATKGARCELISRLSF